VQRTVPRPLALLAVVAAIFFAPLIATLGALCGLGDDGNPHACDGVHRLTSWFVGVALALTALACAWPRRTLRYALWATPTVMLASLIAFAQ
jgi:hypothetical protein